MPLPGVRPRTPSARSRAARPAAVGALLVGLGAACDGPVDPRPKVVYTADKSVAERQTRPYYTDSLLSFERRVFYWTDRVDWASQGASVRAAVAAAATYGDVWRAAAGSIDPWLRNAPPESRDNHSGYFPPFVSPGITDPPPDPRNLPSGVALPGPAGQAGLAYLWLPGFTGTNFTGRADSIQTVIRTLDAADPCGWVLDLRRNSGGYTDVMLAGISPIFGDAPASATQVGYGGEVDRTGARVLWFVTRGRAGVYDPDERRTYEFAHATSPYTLRRPGSPVAVLVGPTTASASEAITLGFRGGPVPSRTFGEPTYGVTTGPVGRYLLPDSGFLNITASIMFDRTGRLYGGKLQPDQLVTGGPGYNALTPTPSASDPVIAAAAAWLRQQTACGGSGPASARLRASREAASPDALPGAALPLAPEFRVPRVFAVPAPAATRR